MGYTGFMLHSGHMLHVWIIQETEEGRKNDVELSAWIIFWLFLFLSVQPWVLKSCVSSYSICKMERVKYLLIALL